MERHSQCLKSDPDIRKGCDQYSHASQISIPRHLVVLPIQNHVNLAASEQSKCEIEVVPILLRPTSNSAFDAGPALVRLNNTPELLRRLSGSLSQPPHASHCRRVSPFEGACRSSLSRHQLQF